MSFVLPPKDLMAGQVMMGNDPKVWAHKCTAAGMRPTINNVGYACIYCGLSQIDFVDGKNPPKANSQQEQEGRRIFAMEQEQYRKAQQLSVDMKATQQPVCLGKEGVITRPGVMTMRDQFAMAALQGILSRNMDGILLQSIAAEAYHVADAMMEARKKEDV